MERKEEAPVVERYNVRSKENNGTFKKSNFTTESIGYVLTQEIRDVCLHFTRI